MKLNSSNLFFLSFMIVGIMLCLCSNNWIFIWCGLELSLITFLPLMQNKLIISSESILKYFIIQSVSSTILILGLLMMVVMKFNYEFMISIALMMKMGIGPFHLWLLSVMSGLHSVPMILLLTVLKISPLVILSLVNTISNSIFIMITMLAGSISGLNQNSTKKIIAYSSIFNMGLILMVIKNNSIWLCYLFIYSIMMLILISLMLNLNLIYINQIIFNEDLMWNKMNLWLILLSMGGMPPLIGFTIKLMVIEFTISNFLIFNTMLIVLLSLLIMYFYLRMTYLSLMFFTVSPKWMLLNLKKLSSSIMLINILSLPMILVMELFN
nr:NADH dehydrogenase subunit 2 [Empoascanara gracilis]